MDTPLAALTRQTVTDEQFEAMQTMKAVKKPIARTRKTRDCTEWLSSLSAADVADRWPKSGADGFYDNERLWLARCSPVGEVRTMAQADLRAKHDALQARRQKNADERWLRETERHEQLAAARASIEGLNAETHGTVKAAAYRASELYSSQHVPRTLKQCIAIASSEHIVAFGAVSAYLSGVGVRTLMAPKLRDGEFLMNEAE